MVSPAQRRRRLQIVALLAAVAMLSSMIVGAINALAGGDDSAAPPEGEAPDDPEPADVILYGDSLATEAVFHFQAELLEADDELAIVPGASPGLAICDFIETISQDLVAYETPEVAVLEFAGNNATPCVADAGGERLTGQALADKYAQDAELVTDVLVQNGIQVLWVGPPPAPGLPGGASEAIDQAYRDLVDEWSEREPDMVHYAPAGEAVTGPGGEYVAALPCLDDERDPEDVLATLDELGLEYEEEELTSGGVGCANDEIQVRNDDEIHFCPVELGADDLICPTYSSGARRYGEAMAAATLDLLD